MAARLSHQELSEIYAGLVLKGKAGLCEPELLADPYGGLISKMKKVKTFGPDDAIRFLGPAAYQAAVLAAETVASIKEANWLMQLEQAYAAYKTGDELIQLGQRMKQGEVVDQQSIYIATKRLSTGSRRAVRLDKIKADKATFIKTGFAPIDDHIGGIVENGLTIIGGRPGFGKTWLMCLLAVCFVALHKTKKAILFTFEMTSGQLANRLLELMQVPAKLRERIYVCDDAEDFEEALATALEDEDYQLIAMDYGELALGDVEESATTVGRMYRRVARFGTKQRKTVLMLSQLNRSPVMNGGPKKVGMSRLKWGGEDAAGLIMQIIGNNDEADILVDGSTLPYDDTVSFIAFVKSRFGFGKHKRQSGAVGVVWSESGGWTNQKNTNWYPIKVRD